MFLLEKVKKSISYLTQKFSQIFFSRKSASEAKNLIRSEKTLSSSENKNSKDVYKEKPKKSYCDLKKEKSLNNLDLNQDDDTPKCNRYCGVKNLLIASEERIYADYGATTPCAPEVLEEMLPYFTNNFGNSSSKSHSFGWEAEEAVEKSRSRISKVIGCSSKEFIFTSGATESNNIGIKGAYAYLNDSFGKNHIITTGIEHKCVLASCEALEKDGAEISYVKVDKYGIVDLEDLKVKIKPTTGLVSIILVNNEIGVIQPISEISKICREKGVILHTDASQALGRIKINASEVDLMSVSGHKVYAPKGIGGLYIKRGVRLKRLISGGGQEKGLRSGTLPVPLCVGFGKAVEMAEELRKSEWHKMCEFSSYLTNYIMSNLEDVTLNGHPDLRIPHNLHFSFSCVEGESLMMQIKEIAVSSGSACTSGSLEPSYVLKAINLREDLIHTGIRIVLGRYTTMEQVKKIGEKIVSAVKKLRSYSPLWDMKLAGISLDSIEWPEHH